jgi:hypothetical protein
MLPGRRPAVTLTGATWRLIAMTPCSLRRRLRAGGCDGGPHCAPQSQQSMLKLLEKMAKLPVIPIPAGWRFQPVDAADIGDRLVELAFGTSAGLVPDIVGPRIYQMAELVLHTCGLAARTGRWQPPTLQSDVAAPLASRACTPFRQDDQGHRGSTAALGRIDRTRLSLGCRSVEEANSCPIPAPRPRRSRS